MQYPVMPTLLLFIDLFEVLNLNIPKFHFEFVISITLSLLFGAYPLPLFCTTKLSQGTMLFCYHNAGEAITIATYSLCPFLIVAVGVRATSLTRFVENTCNICISK